MELADRMAHLERRFDAVVDQRLDRLETKLDALDAKFETKIDALDAKNEVRFARSETKIDRLTWYIVGSWVTIMLAIFSLYFRGGH